MAYVYLDDKFPRHPKVMAAMSIQPLSPWLYVAGLAYCREHLNAGLFQMIIVPTLMPGYKPALLKALLAVALWEDAGEGWIQIHDYVPFNDTEDAQREARSDKAREAANKRWHGSRIDKINAKADARASV